MRSWVWAVAAILLATTAGAAAEKRLRIDSRWRDRDIAIDGDSGDWAGPLAAIDPKHPVTAAVANDDQSLYLVLSTSDPAARRQVMREGLIVWFDPAGGDKKHFGIKFPVGLAITMAGRGGRGRPGPDQPDQIEPPNRLEVYGPAKGDAHSFVVEAAPGIAVKVGHIENYLVYELKVPLAASAATPYAIETKPASLIGVGLETPKSERPRGPGGFGGRGGGMGGRGGGMGGRGMGDWGGGHDELKPLKTWVTVRLAAQ